MSALCLAPVPGSRLDEHLPSVISAWAGCATITGSRFYICCNKLISVLKALIAFLLTRENFNFIHRGMRN